MVLVCEGETLGVVRRGVMAPGALAVALAAALAAALLLLLAPRRVLREGTGGRGAEATPARAAAAGVERAGCCTASPAVGVAG